MDARRIFCFYKKKRILACVACVLLVGFFLVSALFIVKEASHDCCGEGCPVCAVMQMAKHAAHAYGGSTGAAPAGYVFHIVGTCAGAAGCAAAVARSGVEKKVRLNI